MSSTPELDNAAARAGASARRSRFTAWPLWATAAGVLAAVGTLVFDVRPAAELDAYERGEDYIVTPADMMGLDHVSSRLGWTFGLFAVAALFIFQALWRRHVEQRFPNSIGARVVTAGVIATAATAMLGYGWKGALANYLGPESGLYDEAGLFVYYMLTDFGAYLPWFGVAVAALAVAWMAFAERNVSRVLGTVSAILGLGIVAVTLLTGVPGFPGVYGPVWLVILGIWLAVGRSRITQTTVDAK